MDRRDFLKVGGLSLGALAFRPLPPYQGPQPLGLGRVAASWVNVYPQPSLVADVHSHIDRDEIIEIFTREVSDAGPFHNPIWYRIKDGYVHSGNIQLVRWEPQPPVTNIGPNGTLFEISVPYTRAYDQPDQTSDPRYRLYYQSTHWVDAVVRGADGRFWYRLLDDLLLVNYFVRAEHLRKIQPEELTPISPDVPLRSKWIEVSLEWQEVRAYENKRLVMRTSISSGIPDHTPQENGVPTITPTGRFSVGTKTPYRHMGDGRLTSNLEAYELPGVPWVMFFTDTGVAFHGTYWHNDFGRPRSHGCINMRTQDAKWLYRWTLPVGDHNVKRLSGRGTSVVVY